MMKNNKGFTLVELLVVVLIIGILAAMAMPAYFKAVERSRAAEADTIIGAVVNAQNRYKMKTGKYTANWKNIDTAPQGAPSGSAYCTKGTLTAASGEGGTASCSGNGFLIELSTTVNAETGNNNGVKATRVGSGQYKYILWKNYESTENPYCYGTTQDDKDFCMEYTGEDTESAAVKAPFSVREQQED